MPIPSGSDTSCAAARWSARGGPGHRGRRHAGGETDGNGARNLDILVLGALRSRSPERVLSGSLLLTSAQTGQVSRIAMSCALPEAMRDDVDTHVRDGGYGNRASADASSSDTTNDNRPLLGSRTALWSGIRPLVILGRWCVTCSCYSDTSVRVRARRTVSASSATARTMVAAGRI